MRSRSALRDRARSRFIATGSTLLARRRLGCVAASPRGRSPPCSASCAAARAAASCRRRGRAGSARRCRRCAGPSWRRRAARAAAIARAAQLARPLSGRCSSTITPRPARRSRASACGDAPRMRARCRRRAGPAPTAARARAPAFRASGAIVPLHQREVRRVGQLVAVDDAAGTRRARVSSGALGDALDQRLVAAAVVDQVGDGADLQAVLARELDRGRAGAPSCRRPS